jgi:hypothetical protein
MDRKHLAGFGAAVALSLATSSSFAAINSFTTRPAFNAAAGTINANEDFSSFVVDTPFRTVTVAANGFTLRQEGFDQLFRNLIDVNPLTFTDNNGTNHASMYTNFPEATVAATDVRLAFPIKATAFGADFYGIDGAPGGAEGLAMDVIVNGSVAASFPVPNTGAGQFTFFGVVATAGEQIDSVLLRSSLLNPGSGGEGFGMDDAAVRFVPEPTSLLALAAMSLLILRRRRST